MTHAAGGWPRVISIVGPTAAGKSAVALELAEVIGAEIVNADAYQVYRGMDVGTAKPSPEDRARVPHHLLDILDVTQELSVAQYQGMGRHALTHIGARGASAIVVGGSGLYVRGLLDDLRFPGSDPAIRAAWEARLAELGPERLHAILRERDPQAAAHILPSNGRRMVRALEVGELTGGRFVAELPVDGPPLVAHLSIGVDRDRPELDDRIEARVDQMLAGGLLDEVRSLLDRGLREGRTAVRALGYPQLIDVLDGRLTLSEARAHILAATRKYARRQQRWFHRDPRTHWIQAPDPSSTVARILDLDEHLTRTLAP